MSEKDDTQLDAILQDTRKTLFLVDRSESFLMYLRILLERMGFRVVPLKKGSLLRNLMQVKQPEIILLGATLEDCSASEVLADLNEDGWGDVPVVLICNPEDEACSLERPEFEKVSYLGRPVNIFRLYRVIYDIINFRGEKRMNLRTTYREKVGVTCMGRRTELWATTLSEGGVYVRARTDLPQGADVTVEIPLGFEKPTRLSGKVLYAKGAAAGNGSEPGVAIRFDLVEPDQASQLLVCILGLLVGDLLEEQDEPVLSLVSRTSELYEDIVLEHIRMGRELKQYQVQLKNMVDALPLGAVTFSADTDGELTIAAMNPAARTLLGLKKGEGVTAADCRFEWPENDGWETLRELAHGGGTVEMRNVRCKRHPRDRMFDLMAFQSSRGHVTVIVDDVSTRRRKEEDAYRFQKFESLGLLAGGIAHDFNNMLQHISGNIALARVAIDDPSGLDRVRRLLAETDKGIGTAGYLTKQLLTFARGGNPVKEPLALGPLVTEATNFCLHGSTVRTTFDIAEDLRIVEGDQGQLHQVFANIVINARQAMLKGGTVTVRGKNIAVGEGHSVLSPGHYALISISDTGTGIPRRVIKSIFDPYFSTKREGSGLGLSTAYSVVKKHGGWIEVRSVEGEGSTFDVYIPAMVSGEGVKSRGETDKLWKGSGRILVMDDEDSVRDIFCGMLAFLGFEAVAADSGENALSMYREQRAAGRTFDAMILDLTVRGGMGGEETLKSVREIDPNMKVFASSGYSDSTVMADHRAHGFDGILPKPVTLEILSATLQNTFE